MCYFEYHNPVGAFTWRTIYVHTNVTDGPVVSNLFEKLLTGGSLEPTVSGFDFHYLVCNIDTAKEI